MATKRKAKTQTSKTDPVPVTDTPSITSLDQAHQWTHTGTEVLILKCVSPDGTTYRGFKWPLEVGAEVHPDTWDPSPNCGEGLHGWPWGFGLGDGKDPDWSGKWIVFGSNPADIIGNLESQRKCKAKVGIVRFVGDWNAAMRFILPGQMALVSHIAYLSNDTHTTGDSSASSATGYSSASSATGYSSASSATGYSSPSSATGYSSASRATGDSSASSATGDSSASSATGYSSASSATGDSSASVVVGLYGKARAGKFGCIALAWWNPKENRSEMRCRETGCGDGTDNKLKADTWYLLDEFGAFVEAA